MILQARSRRADNIHMALQTDPQEKQSAIQPERAFTPSYKRELTDCKRHRRCDGIKSPRSRAGLDNSGHLHSRIR